MRRFLAKHIGSVWQLELLLLFKESTKPLSIAEASKALYLSADVIGPAINRFRESGLLSTTEADTSRYGYAAVSEPIKSTIDELERYYREQRVNVINLIFSGTIQTFADAFKLRPEEEK